MNSMNTVNLSMAGIQIINLIIILFVLGIGIYLILLVIKALKIYIKKNS